MNKLQLIVLLNSCQISNILGNKYLITYLRNYLRTYLLNYVLTYLLTSRSRVLLEKLTGPQLV